MKQRIRVLTLFILMFQLLTAAASAEEIRQETGPGGFIGYYTGDRLIVGFSPPDINQIFGEGNWRVDTAGLLHLKYMQNGQSLGFGTLSGLIIADTYRKTLSITSGTFVSPASDSNPVKIEGNALLFDVKDLSKVSVDIKDGAYLQGRHFFGCGRFIDCKMKAMVTQQGSYLNLTGRGGFLAPTTRLQEYWRNIEQGLRGIDYARNTDEEKVYEISDLHQLKVLDSTEGMMIEAVPSQEEQEIRQEGVKKGAFGSWQIWGAQKFNIFIAGDLFKITAKQGQNDIILGVRKADDSEGTAEVNIPIGTGEYKFSGINSGFFFFNGANELFYNCRGEGRINPGRQGSDIYNGMSCIAIGESEFEIALRSEAMQNRYRALQMNVKIPGTVTKVIVDRFDVPQPEPVKSYVNLSKEGTNTALVFYENDIKIEPPAGDWAEIGEILAYFPPSVEGRTTDEFHCIIPSIIGENKGCTYNGVGVIGFTEHLPWYRCTSDAECSTGRTCIDKLCVEKARCEYLPQYNPSVSSAMAPLLSGSKLGLLFISWGYSSEDAFDRDIETLVDFHGTGMGLFSAVPFKESKQKFLFYKLHTTEELAWAPVHGIREGLWGRIYSLRYVNSLIRECPRMDQLVVIGSSRMEGFWSGGNAALGDALIRGGDRSRDEADMLDFQEIFIHEFGHSFGGFSDEEYLAWRRFTVIGEIYQFYSEDMIRQLREKLARYR